jgi:hypothetical protein
MCIACCKVTFTGGTIAAQAVVTAEVVREVMR